MSFPLRYAVLLDGAFVIRKLEAQLGRFPTANDVQALAAAIHGHECVSDFSRLRIYFYHARPAVGVLINPISKKRVSLDATAIHDNHKRLLEALETVPDFALRLGETTTTGWKVGRVFLCHMGHRIKRELRVHADREIRVKVPIRAAEPLSPRSPNVTSPCSPMSGFDRSLSGP